MYYVDYERVDETTGESYWRVRRSSDNQGVKAFNSYKEAYEWVESENTKENINKTFSKVFNEFMKS